VLVFIIPEIIDMVAYKYWICGTINERMNPRGTKHDDIHVTAGSPNLDMSAPLTIPINAYTHIDDTE
jgi:hypothetical protein